MITQKFTTTDSHFANYLQQGWEAYMSSGGKYDWQSHDTVRSYVLGGHIQSALPWVEVDFVYIPM